MAVPPSPGEHKDAARGSLMKHSVKGALLSGAVFPGLGQFVLKHYVRGVALMLAVSVGLFEVVKIALEQALAILQRIEWQGGTIDMAAISNAAARASASSSSRTFNLCLFLIIACWLFGTVDAYRLGQKKDREEPSTPGAGPLVDPADG